MNNNILLDAIDDVLSRLDLMSDEELQTEFENHKSGAVGRVFLDAEEFLAFLMNEGVEKYIASVNDLLIEPDLYKTIETHRDLTCKMTEISFENEDVYMLAA